jgi:hypothetical protein
VNNKLFAFRNILEGMMSYIALKVAWGLLIPMPILVLTSPLWWGVLPQNVQDDWNKIDLNPSTTSIYWLVGISVISISIGLFLRWLAFGVLSNNRMRMIILASLVAVLGIFNAGAAMVQIYIFYFDPSPSMPHYAFKYGVVAIFNFMAVAGFLWLILSKKKN